MTNMIAALRRVNSQLPELLSENFVSDLARQTGLRWRKRVLSPVVMVHLLILQVLHCNTAYTHLPRASRLPFTAAAFCKKRKSSSITPILNRASVAAPGFLRPDRLPPHFSRVHVFPGVIASAHSEVSRSYRQAAMDWPDTFC